MAIGAGVSIWLFSNQSKYVGLVPGHFSSAGDLTFEAGFVLTAVIYLAWRLIADRPAAISAGVTS
jgi:NCS1 family nucleobase:cation symporter-1